MRPDCALTARLPLTPPLPAKPQQQPVCACSLCSYTVHTAGPLSCGCMPPCKHQVPEHCRPQFRPCAPKHALLTSPPPATCSPTEDHLYGDKEKFVTSAYRAKLAERQAWLEEQKKK